MSGNNYIYKPESSQKFTNIKVLLRKDIETT